MVTILTWISILADDSLLENAPSSAIQCRWWRKTTKMETRGGESQRVRGPPWNRTEREKGRGQIWTTQLDTVPSALTISQVPSEECKYILSAEIYIFESILSTY